MKAVSRWLDRFCHNHPGLGIPGLIKYIAIGNVAVYVADMLTGGMLTAYLGFNLALILRGQVWRLLTFVFIPISSGGGFWGPFFFAVTTYFYYWIGSSLEQHWGTTRFTVFYGLGVFFNILMSVILYFTLHINMAVTMYYVNMSMFFSFATLYPDMQVLLYGIIPIKVKWLAWLDALFFAYEIFMLLTSRVWLLALMPVVALLNYFIFFGGDLASALTRGRERVRHRASPQTINFKKAQKELQERRGYLHKCSVCGITDQSHPDMEFRYCSKCRGYYCYCANHINNHQHIQ